MKLTKAQQKLFDELKVKANIWCSQEYAPAKGLVDKGLATWSAKDKFGHAHLVLSSQAALSEMQKSS